MRTVQFAPFITPACISLVCRNLLPKAIKSKLLQKAGHGNGSPGIQKGFAGAKAAKRHYRTSLPQGTQQPSIQPAPFTEHQVPVPCAEVVQAELSHFCGCPLTRAFPSTSTWKPQPGRSWRLSPPAKEYLPALLNFSACKLSPSLAACSCHGNTD